MIKKRFLSTQILWGWLFSACCKEKNAEFGWVKKQPVYKGKRLLIVIQSETFSKPGCLGKEDHFEEVNHPYFFENYCKYVLEN